MDTAATALMALGVPVPEGWEGTSPLDFTPPTTSSVIDDGAGTLSTTEFHAIWSASDPESGIAQYRYAIGTYIGGVDVVN